MSPVLDYGTVSQNLVEVRESPILMLPGVSDKFSVLIEGTGTLASATMVLYKDSTDVSATYLSGSTSITGRVITTKTISSLVGGSTYRFYLTFTDDGVSSVRECTIYVPKLGQKPSSYPAALDRYRIAESPLLLYPSQSITGSLVIEGQGTIGASPTMSVYKGLTDDSANVLSGSMSVSGRTITLKVISALKGGSDYLAYVFFTDGGKNTARYIEIIVPKLGVY